MPYTTKNMQDFDLIISFSIFLFRDKEFKIDAKLYATNQNMRSIFFKKNGQLNREEVYVRNK